MPTAGGSRSGGDRKGREHSEDLHEQRRRPRSGNFPKAVLEAVKAHSHSLEFKNF